MVRDNRPRLLILEYGRPLLPAVTGENSARTSKVGLEIVPAVDPSRIEAGTTFEAQATWEGDPIGGDYSAIKVRSPEDLLVVQHAGAVSPAPPPMGRWSLRFRAQASGL